jgi:prevent-host-death family protein
MYAKIPKNVGITQFRLRLADYFKKVVQGEPVVVSNDNIQAVLIDLDSYNSLVEAYEDKKDSEVLINEILKNKGKKMIPWSEVKKKLKL